MGYSISWIAVRGMPSDAVLAELKLRRTGKSEDVPESPMSAIVLSGGWFLVFANGCDYVDRAPLRQVSNSAEVVACAVEEHVMASAARGYSGGEETWCVAHDAQYGLDHLDVTGEPPRQFASIHKRLADKLAAAGGDDSDVDYLFDVPVELAAKLTGFRHDRSPGNDVKFEILK
jgi:hypothetical protein